MFLFTCITIDVFIKNARACQLPYPLSNQWPTCNGGYNTHSKATAAASYGRSPTWLSLYSHFRCLYDAHQSWMCICKPKPQLRIANGNTMEFTCLHNCVVDYDTQLRYQIQHTASCTGHNCSYTYNSIQCNSMFFPVNNYHNK